MENTAKRPRRRGRVHDYKALARYLEKRLFELDVAKERFDKCNMEESTAALVNRVKAAAYVSSVLAVVLEKRDTEGELRKKMDEAWEVVNRLKERLAHLQQ